MSRCVHELCGKEEMAWLPVSELNNYSIEKHPWCIHCGLVKNISDDRPHKIGYWMNLLSYISKQYQLTQCQQRLVAKEIENSEFLDDTFGINGSCQKIIFKKIINKYVNINIDSIIC